MQTGLECNHCLIRRSAGLISRFEADPSRQREILREVLELLKNMDYAKPPVWNGRRIYGLLGRLLGEDDLFRAEKDEQNGAVLKLFGAMEKAVNESSDPFYAALRYALAGNIIDLGAFKEIDIEGEMRRLVAMPLAADDSEELRSAAKKAKRILYLGDNAGEIVADMLFIRQLGGERVTYAVRGGAIINDATMREAESVGMTRLCRVISSGVVAPGTILSEASGEFLREYERADLIISKGQGNFEALCDEKHVGIYFLFVVKCEVVSRHLGYPVKSPLVLRKGET
ncbi:MAG: DUF89 domain-containing protein [Myxococcota bacterium]